MRRDDRKTDLRVEPMEIRFLPSVGVHHTAPPKRVFVATLTPAAVVLPLDNGGSSANGAAAQIQGGGGAAPFALPPLDDPARGKIVFTLDGNQIKVTGYLAHISNVSAITVHYTSDPAVFPLRGSTTSPATQPPALAADTPVLPASTASSSSTMPVPVTSLPQGATSGTVTKTTQNATTNAMIPSPITTKTTLTSITYPPTSTTTMTTNTVVSGAVTNESTPVNPTPPAAPSTGPIYYAGNTVNSALSDGNQTSQAGQISSSNFDQTVALLLNPGNTGGAMPTNSSFTTVIKPQYLQGPLAKRGGYFTFINAMRNGQLYVLVQTNDGYDPATGAQEDSNFPNGELRGPII